MLSASFSALSSLFVLPILVFVSIPLVLSACVTITLSVLTLSLRMSLVYIEVFYALVTNYFFPALPNPSLSTFSASGSVTPTSSRPKNRTRNLSSSALLCRFGDSHASRSSSRSRSRHHSRQRNRSNSSDANSNARGQYHLGINPSGRRQYRNNAATPAPATYLDLSSGDNDRDFELRSLPPAAARRRRSISGSVSSSSSHSFNDESEERSWLSISKRLDASLHHLAMDTSGADPSATSPTRIQTVAYSRRIRYHRRSRTTSSLIPSNSTGSDLSLAEFTRQGRAATAGMDVGLEPPHNFRSQQLFPEPLSMPNAPPTHALFTTSTESHGAGAYFALRRRRSSSGAATSGNTSPGTSVSLEERTSANIGWSIAHHPGGVGLRRRRSSLGATSGPRARFPSLGLGSSH